MKKTLIIEDFYGGQSNSNIKGKRGEYAFSQDFDILSDEGMLQPQLALKNDNSGTVGTSSSIRGYIKASDGNIYGIGISSGNNRLFKKTSITGDWSTVVTASGSSSPTGGIWEYADYLYWFNSSTVISQYGPLSGSPSLTETWDTISGATLVTASVHADNKIYFYERYNVYRYDGTTKPNAAGIMLDLPTNWRIKDIWSEGNNQFILANDVENNVTSKIFIWDPTSEVGTTTWNDDVDIGDYNAQSIKKAGDRFYIICAMWDYKIYSWAGTGYRIRLAKSIPVNSTASFSVNSNAVDVKDGILYFATTCSVSGFNNGVYAYGHKNSNKPKSLWLDRVNHLNDLSSITARALKWIEKSGELNLHLSFDDGTNDYSNREDTNYSSNAVYETINIAPWKGQKSQLKRLICHHQPLPASTKFTFKIKTDFASSWTTIGDSDTTNDTEKDFFGDDSQNALAIGNFHQIRVEATSATTNRPQLIDLTMEFEARGK